MTKLDAKSTTEHATHAERRGFESVWYEVEDLLTVGPVVITDVGEENMYFTLTDGSLGYVKAF